MVLVGPSSNEIAIKSSKEINTHNIPRIVPAGKNGSRSQPEQTLHITLLCSNLDLPETKIRGEKDSSFMQPLTISVSQYELKIKLTFTHSRLQVRGKLCSFHENSSGNRQDKRNYCYCREEIDVVQRILL